MRLEYFLLVVLALAAVHDTAYRRVPNRLVLPALVVTVIFSLFGWNYGGGARIEGLLLMAVVWFPLWQIGLIGGGDHKSLVLLGALFGIENVVLVCATTAVCGGIISSVFVGIRLFKLKERDSFWRVVTNTRVPYVLSIFACAIFVWLVQSRR